MTLLPVAILGLVIGLLSSVLGIGGGIFIVPLLPLVTEISAHDAIATSLMTIFLVSSINLYFFHLKGLVVWPIVYRCLPMSILGAAISAQFVPSLSESVLGWILGLTLATFFFYALYINFFRPPGVQSHAQPGRFIGGGFFAGTLSGLSGIGAGVVLGPILSGAKEVPSEKVSPTVNGIMAGITLAAVVTFFINSSSVTEHSVEIRWSLVGFLFFPAFFSSVFGRRYQGLVTRKLRAGFLCFFLAIMAIKTLWTI